MVVARIRGGVLPVQQSRVATGVVAIVAALLLGGSLLWLFPATKSMLFAQMARLTARRWSPGVNCSV
jgi:hypothetical protein